MRSPVAWSSRFDRFVRIVVAFTVLLPVAELGFVVASPPPVTDAELARDLVERAGVSRGVCAVLGHEGTVALDLARTSELLVHVRDSRAGVVADLRREADAAGFDIRRVVVEQGALDRLPYADNLIDIVIAMETGGDALRSVSASEVLRVLRPEGTAMVRAGEEAALRTWLGAKTAESVETWTDAAGTWMKFQKPVPVGTDEWTHWEHGPDNNPASRDRVIKAPYMTQFLATPFNIGMPSVTTAAGGRTFLAIGHISHHQREWDTLQTLIARNGYNGTVLWERRLPPGYLAHRSAFIATKNTFYMMEGSRCLLLDPATGAEKGSLRIPGVAGHWKWMAMADGVLYLLAGKPDPDVQIMRGDRAFGGWSWADLSRGYYGKRIPFGFGDTIAAYHLEDGRLLWKHREEQALADARGMAILGGRVYLYCPDGHLRALDAARGDVLWTNDDAKVLALIEEPGRDLRSTPGFRTQCLTVATPKALVIQGQTRMNVIAVSTEDGRLLWTKEKVTNNPNAIYADGNLVLGVGEGGNHVVIDPESGEVLGDLKFRKVSCTRLTATPDSFFCRGEGTLRFDRYYKKVLIDGAVRPACNDGALPAGGILYLGPWQCDCNLSLKGAMAKCSAGDFRFDYVATEKERLQLLGDLSVATFGADANDWPTFRSDNNRSASSRVPVPGSLARRWEYTPKSPHVPTAPTAAGGLVFTGGEDGKVRALDARDGTLRWEFGTSGAIKHPPTVWEGRAYVGSGDGYVYALEAATGRLLWKFRGAPVERHIMVYGTMSSTWPIHSGILVHEGVAYFAAGIIDYDGTYVYALDARTGAIKWQNNSSGHLNKELRKGVSAQGILTVQGGHLLLAGGNQVSPARFDLKTGECLARRFDQGQPKANSGRFVGVFREDAVIAGGQTLYAPPSNVSNKGGFVAFGSNGQHRLANGSIPPSWDDNSFVLVNFKHGKVTCCSASKVHERMGKRLDPGQRRRGWLDNLAREFTTDDSLRWQTDLGDSKFEAVSVIVCPNAVVAVVRHQQRFRAQPQWFLTTFDVANGRPMVQHELRAEPLPGGLLVDAGGRIVVTTVDGRVLCLGAGGANRRPGRVRD